MNAMALTLVLLFYLATPGVAEWARRHRYVRIKGHPGKLEAVLGTLLAAAPASRSGS